MASGIPWTTACWPPFRHHRDAPARCPAGPLPTISRSSWPSAPPSWPKPASGPRRRAAPRAPSLANMSHEIRTPMNAILGPGAAARAQPPQPGSRTAWPASAMPAPHLLAIINDILDISKIEAGKLHLDAVDFSPEVLFSQAHRLIHDRIVARKLGFRSDTGDLPPVLRRRDPAAPGPAQLSEQCGEVHRARRP